jgi:hypothetical protein
MLTRQRSRENILATEILPKICRPYVGVGMTVARWIIFGCLLLSMIPTALAQSPTANCTFLTHGPNVEGCRIDNPIVTQSMTQYDGVYHPEIFLASSNNSNNNQFGVALPDIQLRFGDRVTIDAGGCVQTGFHGDTMFPYLEGGDDGRGNIRENNDWYGTLGVINAFLYESGKPLDGKRIINVRGQPFWIAVDQKLRLGYGDTNYKDNGYWGHNTAKCDGTPAFVTVTIEHDVPPPVFPTPKPWDLVTADPTVSEPFDMNGLPFNPKWYWQNFTTFPPLAQDFNDCSLITETRFDTSSCTNLPLSRDTPDDIVKEQLSSCALGHLNWTVVSYKGRLSFVDHDATLKPLDFPSVVGDDDYNFTLVTPVQGDFPSGTTERNPDRIKLEFKASETIDHLTTQWWQKFHSAVDGDTDNINHGKNLVRDTEAIVIGFLGLDLVSHSNEAQTFFTEPKSEIHPVFVLAIHVNRDPSDDTWAIFARNFGNEGFCSNSMHYLDLPSGLITLRLPRLSEDEDNVPTTSFATIITDKTQFVTNDNNVPSPDISEPGPNQDTFVTFHLPSPPFNDEEGALVGGELHLQWGHFTHAAPPISAPNTAPPLVSSVEEDDSGEPEAQLADLFAKLTPHQQATYFAIRSRSPSVPSETFELVPNIVSNPPAFEPVLLPTPPLLGVGPVFSVPLPPERQIWRNVLMSLCGTLQGRLPSDFFASCLPGDLDFDSMTDCSDLAIVKASFGKRMGQAGFDPRADTNGDGVVDVRDLAFVARKLQAGTSCP